MDPTIVVAVISGISSIAVALISKPESNAKNSKSDETHIKSSTTIYQSNRITSSDINQKYGGIPPTHKKSFNKTKIIIVSFLALTSFGATVYNLFSNYQEEKKSEFIKSCLNYKGSGSPDDLDEIIRAYSYIRHFYKRDPVSCSEIQYYRDREKTFR